MRSLAERVRLERGLRVVAYVALVAWIVLALRSSAVVDIVDSRSLAEALPRWTAAGADSVHVRFDTVPDEASAAWLAALRRAGTGVSWSAPSVPATALEVYRSADPGGEIVALAASSGGAVHVLSDALGPIDTLPAVRLAVASRMRTADGDLILSANGQPARASVAVSGAAPRVMVVGQAGWEAKFVIAALEERGWLVSSRLAISPDHLVQQGSAVPDTTQFAAVVLMDSASAELVRGVERFVRDGGGLVLAGDASRATRLAPLIRWETQPRQVALLGTLPGDTLWRGGSRVPLAESNPADAIRLEARGGMATVVARRHYNGRVVAVGYDQTWRWRMAGDGASVTSHREWWSRAVAGAAYRPVSGAERPSGAAPLAATFATLGPPLEPGARPLPLAPGAASLLLGALVLASLLSEWLLRRARGAR